jgi:hypothetical protein
MRDFLTGRGNTHSDATVAQLSAAYAEATTDAHARILRHVIPPPGDDGIVGWGRADKYAYAHLAEHAGAAGELTRLVLDPGYLAWTRLPPLLAMRTTVHDLPARNAIAARELAGDLTATATPERMRWLRASALKCRAAELAEACVPRMNDAFLAHAAIWRGSHHTTLVGHTARANALCTWTVASDRTLLEVLTK